MAVPNFQFECRVLRQVLFHFPVGRVQFRPQQFEFRLGVKGTAQSAGHIVPRGLPAWPLQQFCSGIAVPLASGREDLTALQRLLEPVQHAEGVGLPVDLTLGGEHPPFPGSGHKRSRGLGPFRLAPSTLFLPGQETPGL